jgi:hypothetical protein
MGEGPDRPTLDDAVRAEIRRLRRERHSAERMVEYYEWQLAGLHPSTVARAERFGRPSYESLVAVCEVLGISDWTAVDELASD